jgi:DNA-binding NarL/FixJ family response regulator
MMKPISQLTEQERAVLALLAVGQRNARIADELSISIRTVENHLYHIFHKLGVSSRMEAALYVLRNDLVSNSEMSGITQDM